MPHESILGALLGTLFVNIFINDIFSFLTICDMCNCADDNNPCAYSKEFHQAQGQMKKDFGILENWFYDGYMVINPRKY